MFTDLDPTLIKALMYLEINLISVILVALVHYKTSGMTKMVSQRNFVMAIDSLMVFFVSDTVFAMMFYGFFPKIPALQILTKEIYFMSTSLLCFFWFVYFEHLQDSPFVKNRKRVLWSSALVWLMAVLLLVNLFTGICFRVDADGTYSRGPLFIVLYLISYVYVFATSIRAFSRLFKRQYFSQRSQLIKLALFPVAPAAAGIIQFFVPELPVACAALSIITLIIYMDWTDEMISVDPLTRLNNRKSVDYFYEQWKESREDKATLYLLMIDANRFKSINDTYGHLEGDKALVRIADAMRLSLRGRNNRCILARYGGDEFVILIWEESEVAIENLKALIGRTLKRLNKEAGSPYELSVCIGSEKASHDMQLKDLIELADKNLYAEKEKLR